MSDDFFIQSEEGWSFPNPMSDEVCDAEHRARHSPESLSLSDMVILASVADCYRYLLHSCPTTGIALNKLAKMRRLIKSVNRERPSPPPSLHTMPE